jgi:Mrp family chromosome partitioning ATPase
VAELPDEQPVSGPGPLAAIRRYWRQVVTAVGVLAALTLLYGAVSPPAQTATARIGLTNPKGFDLLSQSGTSGADLGRYASKQAILAQSLAVRQRASQLLGGRLSAAALAGAVQVKPSTNADVLIVSGSATSGRLAADAANAVTNAYIAESQVQIDALLRQGLGAIGSRRAALEQRINNQRTAAQKIAAQSAGDELKELDKNEGSLNIQAGSFGNGVSFTDPASAGGGIAGAVVALIENVMIAALLGLFVAGAVAWWISGRRPRVEDVRQASELLGAPVLAELIGTGPLEADGTRAPAIPPTLHLAASALENHTQGVLLVASPRRGDGRSTAALGLALATAQAGWKVALVDADFRTRRLSTQVPALMGARGLGDVLAGRATLADVAVRLWESDDSLPAPLTAVGAGSIDHIAGLLHSESAARTFAQLGAHHDLVLVDADAAEAGPNTYLLAQRADALVVVVRHGARVADLETFRNRLVQLQTPITGIIYIRHRTTSLLAGGARTPAPRSRTQPVRYRANS